MTNIILAALNLASDASSVSATPNRPLNCITPETVHEGSPSEKRHSCRFRRRYANEATRVSLPRKGPYFGRMQLPVAATP